MALTKKLTPIGNSLGVVIDKPVLELLAIDRDTELEVSTDDGVASSSSRRAFRAPHGSNGRTHVPYGTMERRSGSWASERA